MYRTGQVPARRTLLALGVISGLVALVLALGALVAPAARPAAANSAAQVSSGKGGTSLSPNSTSLVISQVYGGGGNTGSLYTHDFIEIFNPQSSPVVMTNWSVQYAGATGTTWQVSVLTGTITLQPGQYYLIREANGTGGTQPLPTPDSLGSIPLSGTAGKVALVNNSTALSGACPTGPTIVDLVGYGTTANCFEGSGAAPAPANPSSDLRLNGGCTDTDNNTADFVIANPPTPRNSSSAFNPCAGTSTPTPGVINTPTETVTPGGPTNTPTDTATATNTATITSTPTNTPTPFPIHNIQGASHLSPLTGAVVNNVYGIVTVKRANGFYLQDPAPDNNDATSEGIFVFTSSAPPVNVGDAARVNGTVTEFRSGGSGGLNNLTTTEIGSATINVVSTGNVLPTPVVLGIGGRAIPTVVIEDDATGDVETSGTFDPAQDGIDFYESVEGMRVQVNNPVAVGPTTSFGEIPVLADDGAGAGVRTTRGGIIIQPTDYNPERIILDDGILSVPVVNVGDHFSGPAVGVMDYTFANFKLEITQPLTAVSGGLAQETTGPATGSNQIAIANFNVGNLYPTTVSTPQAINRFPLLASIIVNNLKSPDILSLQEIQDNSGPTDNGVVDAAVTINTLITAIQAAGGPTYQYRQINPVNDQDGGQPGGNIRQVFLFRTDRGVSFVDRPGGGSTNSTTVVNGPNGPELSFSPGRIDPQNSAFTNSRKPLAGEFLFNGQRLFVITNHFNSKGGDDPLFGHLQPPTLSSASQRTQQAQIVHDFVAGILALDPNAKVAVQGDLNDFYFSGPVNTLKTGVLNDLIETLPVSERYTYVYEGNSQDLDHILFSNGLNSQLLSYDVVHVAAEFANGVSDHDPEVALVDLPPCGAVINGHLTYQGLAQPNTGNAQAITLQIQPVGGGAVMTYTTSTDANGNFSVTVNGAAPGSYNWWLKSPRYEATAGTLSLAGACTVLTPEFGQQRAGDINNDNCVDTLDFSLLRATFGKTAGDPGYDGRADYNNDSIVDTLDFGLLRSNFGTCGPTP